MMQAGDPQPDQSDDGESLRGRSAGVPSRCRAVHADHAGIPQPVTPLFISRAASISVLPLCWRSGVHKVNNVLA
jgi:hypothetical protein